MRRRALSGLAGVPPRRESRSGAIATKPSFASCSVVCRMKSDMPKISWITITAGAGAGRSGYATYAVTVSPPDRYFTYSAWISADGRTGGRAETRNAAPTTSVAPYQPTARPPVRPSVLPPISHPPDLPAHVVADQQRAVRGHHDAHRPAPARAVGQLPPGDEVVDRHGPAVLDLDPHHLRAGRHRAIPRAVVGDEGVTAVIRRERRTRVERDAEWRRVRLKGDGRRLDCRAVGVRVFGVPLAGEVALRPSVILAVLDDVDPLRWDVVPKVVAVVVRGPELSRRGVEREPHRVPEAARVHAPAAAVAVELHDGRAHRVGLDAQVARRADAH